MKAEEVKKMSTEELAEQLKANKTELSQLKMNHKISGLENPLILRNKRRDVARLATELRTRS